MESIVSVLAIITVCSAFPNINHQDNPDLDRQYHQALEAALADFSQSLYVELAQSSAENFVFSPLSLHSALSLLYLGTRDNSTTQQQLGAAMGIVNNPQLLKQSYQQVVESYKEQQSFLYGNHIWIGNSFALKPGYQDLVSRQFGSEISNLNFSGVGAVEEVNKWIKKMTGGKIKNLVDSFSPDTKMFLANALYFNEKWLEPFEDTDYAGNDFEEYFDTFTEKVKVPMIQQISSKMVYGEIQTNNELLQVVTIPYENSGFEMQIIIPRSAKGLNILEDEMRLKEEQDAKNSFNLFKAPKNNYSGVIDDIKLKMPKFKLRSKFNAANILKDLGATNVFTSRAQLDKMVDGGPLAVGKVLHEACIEVTKEGTEGAAATGVEIVLFSASFGEQKNIVLDRPFIFIVQDRVNNIPVLVGRVKNPSYP
jgi:serpin B